MSVESTEAVRECSNCRCAKPETAAFFHRNGKYFYSICKECCRGIGKQKRQRIRSDPSLLSKRRLYDAGKKREYRERGTEYANRQKDLLRKTYHVKKQDPAWYAAELIRKRGLAFQKYSSDEAFRKRENERSRKFRRDNPEIMRDLDKLAGARKIQRYKEDANYREAVLSNKRSYFSGRMSRDPSFRGKHRARIARYERRLIHATPKWLTPEQVAQIDAIYVAAAYLTAQTQQVHEVDHIIPIQGDHVCGLHVPWNLQVISRSANRSKGNKLP